MSTIIEDVLAAYKNTRTGLTTNPKLLKRRNPSLIEYPDEDITNVLKIYQSDAFALTKPIKTVKNFRSYEAHYVGEQLHADLMFLNTTRNTQQKIIIGNYTYLLVIVDVYSRKLFTRLIKTKKHSEVNEAVADVIDEINREYYGGSMKTRYTVVVDDGSEFHGMKPSHQYRYKISENKWGAVLAEWSIFRLRAKILAVTTARHKVISITDLNNIVENINTTGNKSLGWNTNDLEDPNRRYLTPDEVYYGMKRPHGELNVIKNRDSKFIPGDLVRLANYFDRKGHFVKKSSVTTYTEKIFAVLYVEQDLKQAIWQYKLISIGNNFVLDRLWYEEELTPVNENVRELLTDEKIYAMETFSHDEELFYKIRTSKRDDFK